MNNYRYRWTRHYNVDAQVAGEIFQKCRSDAEVVERASDPASPMHSLFTWDDTTAARSFRLYQAREMRGSLLVEVITKDQKRQHVRAFIRKVDVGYVATLEADDDDLSAAEHRCWLQMKAFKERWRGLQFARGVVDAINEKARTMARRGRRGKAA